MGWVLMSWWVLCLYLKSILMPGLSARSLSMIIQRGATEVTFIFAVCKHHILIISARPHCGAPWYRSGRVLAVSMGYHIASLELISRCKGIRQTWLRFFVVVPVRLVLLQKSVPKPWPALSRLPLVRRLTARPTSKRTVPSLILNRLRSQKTVITTSSKTHET